MKASSKPKHTLSLLGISFVIVIIISACTWLCWEFLSPFIFKSENWFWPKIQNIPAVMFFGLMAFLPIFPIPLSPFYLIIGTIYGVGFSLIATAVVIFINLSLAHYLATGFLRPVIDNIISKYSFTIPKVYPTEYIKLSIALRIAPGIPYFLKNYLNSLAGVPLKSYLLISWPLEMLWALAFILLGESIFEGNFGLTIYSICLVITLILIIKLIREHYAKIY